MMAMLTASSGPIFTAPPCPLYPTAAAPVRIVTAFFSAPALYAIQLSRELAALTATPLRTKLFLAPTQTTRGPPARLT
jgi:hypothetical protein